LVQVFKIVDRYTHTHTHTYTHTHTHTQVHTFTQIYKQTHTHTHIYISTPTHLHTNSRIHSHTHKPRWVSAWPRRRAARPSWWVRARSCPPPRAHALLLTPRPLVPSPRGPRGPGFEPHCSFCLYVLLGLARHSHLLLLLLLLLVVLLLLLLWFYH
jgi:hypothetical protein